MPSASEDLRLLRGELVFSEDPLRLQCGESLELGPAFEESLGGFDPAAVDSTRAELLPRDLDEALDSLEADDVLQDAFDPQLLARLLDGRRAEASDYASHVTQWEIDRYIDEA